MTPKRNSELKLSMTAGDPPEEYFLHKSYNDLVAKGIYEAPYDYSKHPAGYQKQFDTADAKKWLDMIKDKERGQYPHDEPKPASTPSIPQAAITEFKALAEQIADLKILVTKLQSDYDAMKKLAEDTKAQLDEYVRRNPGSKFRIVG